MQKAVELTSQGLTLRGMLHVPETSGEKVPVVIIFHGFTGNKMEPHFIFVKLSRMLEKKGIASIRFDFGCSGESDGDFVDMTLSGEIRDAVNILDYAKSLDFVDKSRIGVVGLSMGGAVASVLAGQRKDDVKCLCLWAPAGNMGELVQNNENIKDIEAIKKQGYADFGGFPVGIGFIEDVMKTDIFGNAKNYDKKILIIHGDNDGVVPVSVSKRYFECYGGRAKLEIIKDADHTFNKVEWEKEVLEKTVAFLSSELTSE